METNGIYYYKLSRNIYEKFIKGMMLSPRESSRNIKLLFLNKTTDNSSKFFQLSPSDVEAIDANEHFLDSLIPVQLGPQQHSLDLPHLPFGLFSATWLFPIAYFEIFCLALFKLLSIHPAFLKILSFWHFQPLPVVCMLQAIICLWHFWAPIAPCLHHYF